VIGQRDGRQLTAHGGFDHALRRKDSVRCS
jgi:hypothetical protein